jgi:hypothetical protein
MNASTLHEEARRWTRFPATLLFAASLLWIITVIPRAATDWDAIVAQPSESLLGAILVFLQLVVMPVAAPLAAVGMLYLQRSALYLGAVLPLIPMLSLSADKAQRIATKFREYRELSSISSFGDGVLDAAITLGLWIILAVHVYYIRRALQEMDKTRQWQRSASGETMVPARLVISGHESADSTLPDETCFLLPDAVERDVED